MDNTILIGVCIGMLIGVAMMILPEYFTTIKADATPPTRNDEYDHT